MAVSLTLWPCDVVRITERRRASIDGCVLRRSCDGLNKISQRATDPFVGTDEKAHGMVVRAFARLSTARRTLWRALVVVEGRCHGGVLLPRLHR